MTIENPNSSGQGYDASHMQHELHTTVVKYGYVYSHSTQVRATDQTTYVHHTYKFGAHNVGLIHANLWETSTSTASGRKHAGKGAVQLDAHLKSKRRRHAELRNVCKGSQSNAVMLQSYLTKSITTKYFGQTNVRGSRIKAACEAGSLTISKGKLDDECIKEDRHHAEVARRLINKLNWGGTWAEGSLADGRHVFVCVDRE